MILEASTLTSAGVKTVDDKSIGTVKQVVFDGHELKVAGFEVQPSKLLPTVTRLDYLQVLSCQPQQITVESKEKLGGELTHFDELKKRYGPVLQVAAKTESGDSLGKVKDVLIEVETGLVIRFYLQSLIKERIIPRQYVVALTPKTIVFQDVVNQPHFDDLATSQMPGLAAS